MTTDECQVACRYISNCKFVIYNKNSRECQLHTSEIGDRKCDIVHGTISPNFKDCVRDNKIPWTSVPGQYTVENILIEYNPEVLKYFNVLSANT